MCMHMYLGELTGVCIGMCMDPCKDMCTDLHVGLGKCDELGQDLSYMEIVHLIPVL